MKVSLNLKECNRIVRGLFSYVHKLHLFVTNEISYLHAVSLYKKIIFYSGTRASTIYRSGQIPIVAQVKVHKEREQMKTSRFSAKAIVLCLQPSFWFHTGGGNLEGVNRYLI